MLVIAVIGSFKRYPHLRWRRCGSADLEAKVLAADEAVVRERAGRYRSRSGALDLRRPVRAVTETHEDCPDIRFAIEAVEGERIYVIQEQPGRRAGDRRGRDEE